MSHTRNTRIPKNAHKNFFWPTIPTRHELHEAWATANGYRPQAPSIKRAGGPAGIKHQASKEKLDKSSGLGYCRTNGKVQQRSRFVGPSHITNARNAHFVRSSKRAARQYPGLPVDSNVIMVMERPGDRDQQPQAPSLKQTPDKRRKHQAPSYKPQA